ncbi:MAG: hypothetical protein HYY93_03455 [Planctomycetes bacterium]|nr:hypothetical protein [Planctomycetota bacterium]
MALRRRPRCLALALGLLTAVLSGPRSFAQEENYGAAEVTAAEFEAIAKSAKEAEAHVSEARTAVSNAAQIIEKSDLTSKEKREALSKVKEVSNALQKYHVPLKRFTDMVAPIAKAKEVFDEISGFRGEVEEHRRNQGALAGDMKVIATLMERFGGKVPILGRFIKTYGEVTNAMLEATGKVAGKLAEQRGSDMVGAIGSAVTRGPNREKNAALDEQFPELCASRKFEPSQPGWLYRPIDSPTPQLIWDAEDGRWLMVPEDADARTIFRLCLRTCKRLSPKELHERCKHWKTQQNRLSAGREILAFLKTIRLSTGQARGAFRDTYAESNLKLKGVMNDSFDDPEAMDARYTCDSWARHEVNGFLGRLYTALVKRKTSPGTIAELVAIARKYDIREVLDLLKKEEGPGKLGCTGLKFSLEAPEPGREGRKDWAPSIGFELETTEEGFLLKGTRFEGRTVRNDSHGTDVTDVSGRVAPDMSRIESLTISRHIVNKSLQEDQRVEETTFRVTLVGIPQIRRGEDPLYYAYSAYENRKVGPNAHGKLPSGFRFESVQYSYSEKWVGRDQETHSTSLEGMNVEDLRYFSIKVSLSPLGGR